MNFIVVGTNYRYSSLCLRERISFSKAQAVRMLSWMAEVEGIGSSLILSTCNRVEVYAEAQDIEREIASVKRIMALFHEVLLRELEPALYHYRGLDALQHLFRVAAGLDSQVIGETQIMGQLREAYRLAREANTVSPAFGKLFERSFSAAGKARSETGISTGNLSIANLALRLLRKNGLNLRMSKLLILGCGEMSRLIAKELSEEVVYPVFVSSRTHEKAVRMAREFSGRALSIEEMKLELGSADILISSTRSPRWILKKSDFCIREKPLFVIDLAVPRDIDPAVRELNGIQLFDLDGLKSVTQENWQRRNEAAIAAGEMLEKEAEKTWRLFSTRVPEKARLQ